MRAFGAIVAGVVVLGIVVISLQMMSTRMYPLPEGLDVGDPTQIVALEEHIASLPTLGWTIAFVSEVLGAFLGALTAAWIAPRRRKLAAGSIVGLALLGSLMNWTSFAHPLPYIVGQLAGYPLALAAALRIAPQPATDSDGVAE